VLLEGVGHTSTFLITKIMQRWAWLVLEFFFFYTYNILTLLSASHIYIESLSLAPDVSFCRKEFSASCEEERRPEVSNQSRIKCREKLSTQV
jgi:hypothetical protein